jgi:hypothetical protein
MAVASRRRAEQAERNVYNKRLKTNTIRINVQPVFLVVDSYFWCDRRRPMQIPTRDVNCTDDNEQYSKRAAKKLENMLGYIYFQFE